MILLHETPERIRCCHRRQRLQIAVPAVDDLVTLCSEETDSRIPEIFHDTALSGYDPARADRELSLIPVSVRPAAVIILIIHPDDRPDHRILQTCYTLQPASHQTLLQRQLGAVTQPAELAAAAAVFKKLTIEFICTIRRLLQHIEQSREPVVLLYLRQLSTHDIACNCSRHEHNKPVGSLSDPLALAAHILDPDFNYISFFHIISFSQNKSGVATIFSSLTFTGIPAFSLRQEISQAIFHGYGKAASATF